LEILSKKLGLLREMNMLGDEVSRVDIRFFQPKKVSPSTLSAIGLSHVKFVDIAPVTNTVKMHCKDNVELYLSQCSGEAQYGWILSVCGRIALKLIGHVVVKHEDGSFLCVTPPEEQIERITFLPDDNVKNLCINNCLPTKHYALIDDNFVSEYVEFENRFDTLRLESGGVISSADVGVINSQRFLAAKNFYEVLKAKTKKDDPCFCGSLKLAKKCHLKNR
jgi:HTH-type transcriptional repressor of NAD biosynthesis genes